MRFKLIALAIVAGLGATSFTAAAAPAQQVVSSSEVELLKAQLAALQAKVDALEQRTDAQSDINVSTGQAVEKATNVTAASDKKLEALEKARRDGVLDLPDGEQLKVTNLHKVFWPKQKLTKGDLFRYYVRVARFLLPAVADRPLVMKRFPNGIAAAPFYQHRAPDVPAGVRTAVVSVVEQRPQIIGGDLKSLLYMTQIAAISQDPWFSRAQSPHEPDHVAIDLDPTDTATFAHVLDVARWVRDELTSLGVPAFPKTSGSNGMHIYIPLKPHTSYESGMLFCQIVATLVATRHPKAATVERMVARRRRGTIYIDYLQNILGKTLATAYSARASDYAGVSTPLTWKEVDAGVDPREFTIRTAPARFRKAGDLWKGLRESDPADLESILQKYRRA